MSNMRKQRRIKNKKTHQMLVWRRRTTFGEIFFPTMLYSPEDL